MRRPGDEITVLDVSFDKNREAVRTALDSGAKVFYSDHHFPGDLLAHENLELYIDPAAETCTSLIINDYLNGEHAHWAVVGAFGDNFDAAATKLGKKLGLDNNQLTEYQELGICLNYNGYGFEIEDLLFHPADLFTLINLYHSPFEFIQNEPGYTELRNQYQTDMALSQSTRPETESDKTALYLLPNESWAKRIVGVMGNDLAKQFPDRAHALLVDMGDGNYRVSVRAPYNTKSGADELCRQFETGGGRKAAAGINSLPESQMTEFKKQCLLQFGGS